MAPVVATTTLATSAAASATLSDASPASWCDKSVSTPSTTESYEPGAPAPACPNAAPRSDETIALSMAGAEGAPAAEITAIDMIRTTQHGTAPAPVMPAGRAAPPIARHPRSIIANIPARALPTVIVPTVVIAAPDELGFLDRTECRVCRRQSGKARHGRCQCACPKAPAARTAAVAKPKKLASHSLLHQIPTYFGRSANLWELRRFRPAARARGRFRGTAANSHWSKMLRRPPRVG